MEITITTKAGKFVMKGEEFVKAYGKYVNRVVGLDANDKAILKEFLSTYEEEVKTEDDGEEEAYENNGREEAFEV